MDERLLTVDEDDPRFCPHFGDGTPKAQCSRCRTPATVTAPTAQVSLL